MLNFDKIQRLCASRYTKTRSLCELEIKEKNKFFSFIIRERGQSC